MKPFLSLSQSLLALLAAISFTMLHSNAANDLGTTNTEALAHFWSTVENSNRPVTVISFGDSMADSYRSPSFHLMNKLIGRCGSAGYSLNN